MQMNSSPDKVLVIAEEASLRSHIRHTLEAFGFDMGEASDSENAQMRLRMVDYEAVLLNLPTPETNDVSICRQLRGLHPRLPILILSPHDSLDHKVEAFEAGADDYVIRPFSERELNARIRSAIRRYRASAVGAIERFVIGDIVFDSTMRRLEKAGSQIPLTPLEFRALHVLMAQAGKPVTHATLLNMLWGQERTEHREHLRVLISALRKKIEDDPAHPTYLLTHSHFGYLFREA
jgi:two-component system KDP operon response regulator KdpE